MAEVCTALRSAFAAALMILATAAGAQTSGTVGQINSGTRETAEVPGVKSGEGAMSGMGATPVGDYPKLTIDTLMNLEVSGMSASDGPTRKAQPYVRFDTVLALDTTPDLTLYGLFQFKARQARPADDVNRDLFANQGAGRRVGGKMKELYARHGDWRFGKFVQDFGRAYALLPGPFAADLLEEADEGYEPSDMIGVEKLHVYDSERFGWQQLTLGAFMVDRTVLHESFPFNEGRIRYRDGGVGNTKLPTNLLITWDVLNMPLGGNVQASFQASAIRYGKSYRADKGEFWTTIGTDIAIPLQGSVESTLQSRFTQLRFYVEAARRANFGGIAGRRRNFVSGSVELLSGAWSFDLTTTQRWTTDLVEPTQKDRLYTATVGRNFRTQSQWMLSIAKERVADRSGVYAGVRLAQTLTSCSRCTTRATAY